MNDSFKSFPYGTTPTKPSTLTSLINKSQEKTKHKRRIRYAATPDKYNLIEMQRHVNKVKHKYPPMPKNIEKLYKLDTEQRQLREQLYRSIQEEKEKITYSFRPEIDKNSELMVKNNKQELVSRNLIWLKEKEDKIKQLQEIKQRDEEEKEAMAMKEALEIPRSKIKVNSKLKEYLDTNAYLTRAKSANRNNDYRSLSFTRPKKDDISYCTSKVN